MKKPISPTWTSEEKEQLKKAKELQKQARRAANSSDYGSEEYWGYAKEELEIERGHGVAVDARGMPL